MVIDNYQSVNKSFHKKQLVYRIGMSAGFFSEYNNMILAMAYCLRHHIQFKLSSLNANFDEKNGWKGLFEPFCEEVDSPTGIHIKTVNWRYALKQIAFKHDLAGFHSLIPYITFWKRRYLTQDVFGKCRDPKEMNKAYNIPELNLTDKSLIEVCAELVRTTWHFNRDTQTVIQSIVEPLNLPEQYIGMHIRGGDKFVEHKLESIDKYFSKIRPDNAALHNVFVLTDDYRIIEQISTQYPDWNCYTLCRPEERGYFHENFLKEDYDFKRKQLITLFASIELLNGSKQFIGTFSSNPGMFLGMRNKEIATGVDFDDWTLW